MIVNTNSAIYHLLDPIYGLVSKLRPLLLSNMYSKDIIIIELIECIRSIMDPMSIDFDISNYSFCIKFKKSAMKKMGIVGMPNMPLFMVQSFIIDIFASFINNHRQEIESMISDNHLSDNARETVNILLSNRNTLVNICAVTVISDNVFVIKL